MKSKSNSEVGFFKCKKPVFEIVMLFICCAVSTQAATIQTQVVDGIAWKFRIENERATICGGSSSDNAIPTSTQGDIEVPTRLGNKLVTQIGMGAFFGCSELTQVKIPSAVTYIGMSAFNGCSSITNMTIPKSVTDIYDNGRTVFWGCSGIKSVTIPQFVCSLKMSDVFPSAYQTIETVSVSKGVTNLASYVFRDCEALKNVTLPDTLKKIGYGAFKGCSSLTNVKIPFRVTKIQGETFRDCSALTEINLQSPNYIGEIGNLAFSGCTSLTNVSIHSSTTTIGEYAFSDCIGLQKVSISNLEKWCKIKFANNSANPLLCANKLCLNGEVVSSLTIPDTITDINAYVFYGCDTLVNITIPNTVTNIGKSAFAACNSPERTVTFLGDAPNGIVASEIIESASSVFYPQKYADSFEGIVPAAKFGGYVQSAEVWNIAFDANGGLIDGWETTRYVEVEDGAKFADSLGELPTPERMGYDFKGWFTDKDGGTQILDTTTAIADATYYAHWEENNEGCVVDGVRWFYRDSNELGGVEIIGVGGNIPSALVIPRELNGSNVVSIGAYSLSRSSWGEVHSTLLDGVVSLTLHEGLKRIGRGAFEGCLFNSVYIPSTLDTIESFAFNECFNLTSITMSEGVCALNECCFGSCKALTDVVLPSSITNLERSIFGDCSSLTNVTFKGARPSLISSIIVDEIWDNVFYHIPAGLCVYVMDGKGWKDDNGERLATWCGRPVIFAALPDMGDNATAEDIAEAFDGVQDGRLAAHITDKSGYNLFRHWLNRACGSDFAKRQAVKDSAHAWLSFALDADALIVTLPKQGDLRIDTFKPSATSGAFDFDISVENIAIGEGATAANLAEIFGIEGATTPNGEYSSSGVEMSFGTPTNGKVRCTARPKDASAKSFFMRVKMTP